MRGFYTPPTPPQLLPHYHHTSLGQSYTRYKGGGKVGQYGGGMIGRETRFTEKRGSEQSQTEEFWISGDFCAYDW